MAGRLPITKRPNHPDSSPQETAVLQRQIDDLRRRLAQHEPVEGALRIFRNLYEAMTEGVALHEVVVDADRKPIDYRIMEVNPAYESIIGIRRDEARGKLASELYGTSSPPYLKEYSHVAFSGVPVSFDTYFPPMDKHFTIKVFSHHPGHFATVFEDITSRKQAEEKIRKSEELFRTIAEKAVDSIFTKDLDRRYTFVNPAMAQVFGVDGATLIGKTPGELFDAETAAIIDEVDIATLEGHVVDEIRRLSLGDESRDFHTVQVPLKHNGGDVYGMLGFVRDVTEKKRRETELRHQQKLEALGTLAGGVAHEINNPINIIANYAELIQSRVSPDDTIADYSQEILSESDRIAKIVANLLAFARQDIEEPAPAIMPEIIETTLSLTGKILTQHHIELKLELPADLPSITCRRQQIMQVLLNLLTNAKDALNDKYPQYNEDKIIHISCKVVQRGNARWLRCIVKDHGTGIPADQIEKVFDPFYTTKAPHKGTGLGLAISHNIITEHGGELRIESRPGSYTRFIINLPV